MDTPEHSVANESQDCATELLASDRECSGLDEDRRPIVVVEQNPETRNGAIGTALDNALALWRADNDSRALRRALVQVLVALEEL